MMKSRPSRDVEDSGEAARARTRAESYVARLTGLRPEAIVFCLDGDYRYLAFSEGHRAEMREAWKAEIEAGVSILDYMDLPALREAAKASFDRVLAGEAFHETRPQTGTELCYDLTFFPLLDEAGEPRGVAVSVSRLGDLALAEAAESRTRALLEESQALAHVGGWEYDVARRRVEWTAEVYRIYGLDPGYDPNDIGNDIAFYAPRDQAAIESAFDRAVLLGEAYDLELELVRADGRSIWVRTTARPTMEGERVVRLSGNIMDIDARKRAELELRGLNARLDRQVAERTAQLEAANRELETFAFSISHDLKAPLRAIQGFSSILLDEYGPCLDEEGRRLLGIVGSNAAKMGELISEILALSRVGLLELRISRIDMGAMADAMYHELATAEELATFSFARPELPQAWGDPTLIRLVWGNLLSNALKYSRGAARKALEIEAIPVGALVRYVVRDHGAGFDPAFANRLWKPFQRLHRAELCEGNGVGLAIVKVIIERHGGSVDAWGSPGEGAAFGFSLPAGPASKEGADASG
jgi:PAS domain S-box-containing protein